MHFFFLSLQFTIHMYVLVQCSPWGTNFCLYVIIFCSIDRDDSNWKVARGDMVQWFWFWKIKLIKKTICIVNIVILHKVLDRNNFINSHLGVVHTNHPDPYCWMRDAFLMSGGPPCGLQQSEGWSFCSFWLVMEWLKSSSSFTTLCLQ